MPYHSKDFIRLARPQHYIKNGLLFLPLFFGYQLTNISSLIYVFLACVSFSFAASSQYVLNDIRDSKEDSRHPIKSERPIACGKIRHVHAYFFCFVLALASLLIGIVLLNLSFVMTLGAYFVLNICYSYYLKHIAIVDIVCITISYVLRVLAGALVIGIAPSHWIILMTFLLALFIVLAKRRDDLIFAMSGQNTRKCIEHYNFEFVSGAMMIMASVTIVSYILYTLSPEVIEKHGTNNLYITTFWVIIGFLRYMQLTFVYEKSGDPIVIILKDTFLQMVIFLWILTFAILLYVADF
jgi:4-hydroxybenzoate polyprenyltransferase